LSIIFVVILAHTLNRKLFLPIRQITKTAVYLAGDDSASEGKDASVFFDTDRNDEIGSLSNALQKILLDSKNSRDNLSKALYDANHDGMTQMLNKRLYNSVVDSFRNRSSLCLIYFDVNNLKLMNDTLGHENGDYVIKAAADYLRTILGPNDMCFRMGGDEFLVILPDCSYRTIDSLVDNLEKECPIILSKPTDSVKCALSFGYAYAKGEYSYDELLAEAEENMYTKKAELKKQLQMPER
jgi:diguanylate cyclase (GGDEF)-like protein